MFQRAVTITIVALVFFVFLYLIFWPKNKKYAEIIDEKGKEE